MKKYLAIIKNLDKKTYLRTEKGGKITHTKYKQNALLFFEEWDAESTLEYLNDNFQDCYQLITKTKKP